MQANYFDILSGLSHNGVPHIAEDILSSLDPDTLKQAENVCQTWQQIIIEGNCWRKVIQRQMQTDATWRAIIKRREWNYYLYSPTHLLPTNICSNFSEMGRRIMQDIKDVESNWRQSIFTVKCIDFRAEPWTLTSCLQLYDEKIIAGNCIGNINIFDMKTLELLKTLTAHTNIITHLEIDGNLLVSSAKDDTFRLWNIENWTLLQIFAHDHVNNLEIRFKHLTIVGITNFNTISVWNISRSHGNNITFRANLSNKREPAFSFDLNEKYIVSGGLDVYTVWSTETCQLVRELKCSMCCGPTCIALYDQLLICGGKDEKIQVWNIETGINIFELELGMPVFQLCLTKNRFVCSDNLGLMKVFELPAIFDDNAALDCIVLPNSNLAMRDIKMNELYIMTASDSYYIKIWDFFKKQEE